MNEWMMLAAPYVTELERLLHYVKMNWMNLVINCKQEAHLLLR